MRSVLIATVVTIFVTAAKALTEVVLILAEIDIVAVVSVTGSLESVAVVRVELPSVLTISQPCAIALFVTGVHGPAAQSRAILIHFEATVVAVVSIVRISVLRVS